ncbi:FkbM family methyltransferase [Sphingomonas sp. NSE70-1]|uniref:FkbM family methyltransferase n=1 Tax=Sphingomonas caseinilyticus TaxID=2908205 RepID=A0ABT0RQW1_9SPHN|nr:FkbM family methyltransferase [Sphingomonas caseinilyticus]MCL6697304.1 FkbM family methyltransferase [Sphingomonas caseinilyticus]
MPQRPSRDPRSADEESAVERHVLRTKWLEQTFDEVEHGGRTMRFATTGSSSVKRLRSLFSKEPITLAWIDSFVEGETLFDIGANVGMYTIYAAIMRKAGVYAFEPEALNFAELNKNIFLNGLHHQVLAYGLALSDVDKTDRLLLSDFGLGISHHDFEENSWTEDKQFAPDWKVSKDDRRPQGCIGRKLDTLIADGLPFPDHIKIDVDGLEHRVVAGMLETLADPRLQTVLIEINFDNPKNLEIIDRIVELGWRYSWDQLRTHRTVKFSVEQIRSYQQRGVGGLNYIFFRDDWYDEYFSEVFANYTPGERILSRSRQAETFVETQS